MPEFSLQPLDIGDVKLARYHETTTDWFEIILLCKQLKSSGTNKIQTKFYKSWNIYKTQFTDLIFIKNYMW